MQAFVRNQHDAVTLASQNPISRLGEPGCTEEVVSVKIEFLVGAPGNEVHRRWHSHRHLHHCQHRTLEEHCGEPQEHTEWFNIKAFGKRAEGVAEHLHKGGRIFLEGRQRTQSWDDKQSGSKKYMTFVYADKVEFLGESQRDGKKGELTLDQS